MHKHDTDSLLLASSSRVGMGITWMQPSGALLSLDEPRAPHLLGTVRPIEGTGMRHRRTNRQGWLNHRRGPAGLMA